MKIPNRKPLINALITFAFILIIIFISWVLSGIICNRPLIEPRFYCIGCKDPQWIKGTEVHSGEFLCDKCWDNLSLQARKDLDWEMEGCEKMGKEIFSKVRGYLE